MDPLKEGESAISLPTWMFAGPPSSQPPACAGMDSGWVFSEAVWWRAKDGSRAWPHSGKSGKKINFPSLSHFMGPFWKNELQTRGPETLSEGSKPHSQLMFRPLLTWWTDYTIWVSFYTIWVTLTVPVRVSSLLPPWKPAPGKTGSRVPRRKPLGGMSLSR